MTSPLATSRPVTRHTAEIAPVAGDDEVAVEEPLEVRVEGRSIAITMRTPGHDEELAAGFLLTEGVVERAADIFEINQCPTTAEQTGNIIDVLLRSPEKLDYAALTRHVFSSSSCGLCGKATLEAVGRRFPPLPPGPVMTLDQLHHVADQLFKQQSTFHATGGLHAAALFDATGCVLVVREDVGRHNAVDKVVGYALIQDSPIKNPPSKIQNPTGLFVSGRVSFEIMQKALAARLTIVAAVSAPTSLAVDFAQAHGQTLVGFLRPGRANLYAGQLAPL